jgi:hypothetical protein
MTALEDDLRAALRDRATGDLPDNPTRTAAVRARIRQARARRTAAAAAVVVAALAGTAAVLGLPGRTRTIPAAPLRPVFDRTGTEAHLPGYDTLSFLLFAENGGAGGEMAPDDRPYLVAVYCPTPGHAELTGASIDAKAGAPGNSARISCDQPIPGGYQGTLELDAAARRALFGTNGQVSAVVDSKGLWAIALLAPGWPDWVPTTEPILTFDGREHPDGGTFTGWLQDDGSIQIEGQCIPGVVLSFRVGHTDVGSVRCTDAAADYGVGRAPFGAPRAKVQITVSRTGLDTNQWTVLRAGPPQP